MSALVKLIVFFVFVGIAKLLVYAFNIPTTEALGYCIIWILITLATMLKGNK